MALNSGALTWLEISKGALRNNVEQLKGMIPAKMKFMAVLKANAYGNGLLEVVEQIKDEVDYLAVYEFGDALILRENDVKQPILVLGRTLPEQIQVAIDNDIEVTVSTFDILEAADERLKIHICAETGFGRDGFAVSDKMKVMILLAGKRLNVTGLYSHFAAADDSAFDSYSRKQVDQLLEWKESFKEVGLNPLLHKGGSSAIFNHDANDEFDMVRSGISIYGIWPSLELKNKFQDKVELIPSLTWKAKIVEIKLLPKGSAITYGCTHILERDSKIAILPIGYFNGVFRSSSNHGQFLVKGERVNQIGRVTMNSVVCDVTDIDVKVGDVVTVIGRDGKEVIDADEWAQWAQAFSYEIVARINSNFTRVVVE